MRNSGMRSYTPTLALALFGATTALAQSDTPLASKHFEYTAIPYMVDTNDGPRGRQTGFNICNGTTFGNTSKCQTAMINSLDDFCIWGPQEPNSSIADTEGSLVAYCTKAELHGARPIPPGALTGVQFIKTPDYVQVTGLIKQPNIRDGDSGGEEDPHGADGRGNPLGGLVYSNAFSSNNGSNKTFQQVVEWHNFIGGNRFCFKACDPAGKNAARLCEHIYDRIGCQYNAPAAYQDGVFLKCDGENQDPPGIYTGADGQVSTYSQPPESLGPIQTISYTARIPATSNCVTYKSEELYATASNTNSTTAGGSSSGSSSGSATKTGSGASPSNTQGSNSALGAGPRVGAVLVAAAVLAALVM